MGTMKKCLLRSRRLISTLKNICDGGGYVIGFEFELLSLYEDDEIERDLKLLLGKKITRDIVITNDCSIKRDRNTRYNNGWSAWEIITPPIPNNEAFDVLVKIQDYLINTDVVTNNSCGFHVNVSADTMKSFSSATLISIVDEFKFSKTFNRVDNPYCIPWSFYFDELVKRIKRDKHCLNKQSAFKRNALALIDASSKGEFIDDNELKYATNVSSFFDDKYITINVNKLVTRKPYIEFRMM